MTTTRKLTYHMLTLRNAAVALTRGVSQRTRESWQCIVTTVAACVLVTGCSDIGGGGIVGTGKTLDPTEFRGVTIGILDGFGSVIINNRRFDTDDATFFLNDEVADITDFRVGMNVTASVNFISLQAEEVRYTPILVGAITEYYEATGEITVLDQSVQLSENTVLDEITTDALVQGAILEVSGVRNGSGSIMANYIRLAPGSVNTEVSSFVVGLIDSVDEESNVALVSGTFVSYQEMLEASGLPPAEFVAAFLSKGSVVKTDVVVENDEPIVRECTLFVSASNNLVVTSNGADGADGANDGSENDDREGNSAVGTSSSSGVAFSNIVARPDGGITIGDLTIDQNGLVIDRPGTDRDVEVSFGPDGGVTLTRNCLVAESITVVEQEPLRIGEKVELSGIVSGISEDGRIVVNGFSVNINQNTVVFSGFGDELSEYVISQDDSVLVYGKVRSKNRILAKEIYLDHRQ